MKKTLKCALVLLLTLALEFVLHSEQNDSNPAGKILPTQLDGKITGWGKTTHLLTVDVRGTALNINVTPQVKITKNGKPAKITQLATGQSVRLQFMELPSGKLEVAGLFVDPPSERAEVNKSEPDPGVPLGR